MEALKIDREALLKRVSQAFAVQVSCCLCNFTA
jgi:hypothetical protein